MCLFVLNNLFHYIRLANKQDVSGALDEEDIVDVLQLEGLANQFKTPCHVVSLVIN